MYTKPALRAHLASHARDLRGERAQLLHHRVDRLFELQDLAPHIHRDLARQVAVCDGNRDFGDITNLPRKVRSHRVHIVRQILPCARNARNQRLSAEFALRADLARHAAHFRREGVQLIHHRIDGVLELKNFAFHVYRDLAREVPSRDSCGHIRDVANLSCKVRGHPIDIIREVLPCAGDAGDFRLAAEFALCAHFARHASHFGRKGAQLFDHGVDGVLELKNLSAHVHRNLFRQVAVGHGDSDLGDVPHLGREISRHLVDINGQILPCARNARNLRLSAQLAFGAHLARHAAHLGRKGIELVHHRVHGFFDLKDFSFHFDGHFLPQIARGDGRGDLGYVAQLHGEIRCHQVHRIGEVLPGAGNAGNDGLTAEPAIGSDFTRDSCHFRRESVELVHHRVDRVFQLENLAANVHCDLAREVPAGHGRGHVGDVADLTRQVGSHRVDVIRQIFPCAGDSRHDGLSAKSSFGSDLTGDAAHFRREGVELIHHGVDGVFQLENFAFHVHRNLA